MKKIIFIVLVLIILASVTVYVRSFNKKTDFPSMNADNNTEVNASPTLPAEDFSVFAENLDTPWDIAFLPDTRIIFTERPGRLHIVDPTGEPVIAPIQIEGVLEIGEGGLLGVAVHPDFSTNNYLYIYFTYSGGTNTNTSNRVVRYTLENNSLSERTVVVDAIPGASNHNGGQIEFGPDNFLYITTGDAQDPSRAQDTRSLAGKILRVTDDGKPAPGNPFGNEVYSYGHRNPQGLAWDASGNLWSTEHGRSGIASGLDEVNFIQAGKNYGWPAIEGDKTQSGMESPVIHSGNTTWAPAGAAITGDTLYFVGLRGQSLYTVTLNGQSATLSETYYSSEYGRLRAITIGPDNHLYISTSNQDGRGNPEATDDRIFRINPSNL